MFKNFLIALIICSVCTASYSFADSSRKGATGGNTIGSPDPRPLADDDYYSCNGKKSDGSDPDPKTATTVAAKKQEDCRSCASNQCDRCCKYFVGDDTSNTYKECCAKKCGHNYPQSLIA